MNEEGTSGREDLDKQGEKVYLRKDRGSAVAILLGEAPGRSKVSETIER